MNILEYRLDFTYKEINNLMFVDNFELNKEWEIIIIKDIKNIMLSYMDKNANVDSQANYDIALFNKGKWLYLHENKGTVITGTDKLFDIKGLEILDYKFNPLMSYYTFNFDFHTLLTVLQLNKINILEYKKIALIEAKIIYKGLKIIINGSSLSYRGMFHNDFSEICEEINQMYQNEYKPILELFKKMDEPEIDPKMTHKAMAFKTWYNAKRQNQREWPLVSHIKRKNSIEFPKDSGIYYYSPNKYVGLGLRNDINSEICIPKIYNTDHSKNPKTILYKYLNNLEIKEEKNKIPHTLKYSEYTNLKYIKELENEKYMEISYDGKVIDTVNGANCIVYNNNIIKYIRSDPLPKNWPFSAQKLNKNNERIMVYNDNGKWINNSGNKIRGIPALPYNYKQILHDYKKLGRLIKGEIMDLTHIGIVNPIGNDIITYPYIDDIYVGKVLETHRMMTFKYKKNIKTTILYDI